jgi:N-methylhydantoinase B
MNHPSRQSTSISVDPITLEVIRHGIVSITDQIDANISRTAFSPYIYEYKDFAVGLVSAEGELIAQCTGGMPVFVADSVGMAVRDGLAVYGRERLHRGESVERDLRRGYISVEAAKRDYGIEERMKAEG